MPPGLAFNLLDYIELLDWTGRQIREDKLGSIDAAIPPALARIDISPAHWLALHPLRRSVQGTRRLKALT